MAGKGVESEKGKAAAVAVELDQDDVFSSRQGPTCPYLERFDDSPVLCVRNETLQLYPYRSLHGDEIRLLTIEPGQTNDPLSAKLHYASITTDQKYEALSYCWHKSITRPSVTEDDTVIELAIWATERDNIDLSSKPATSEKIKFSELRYHPHAWHMYYSQGGSYPPKVILCDNHHVEIGGELFVALKHLRREEGARVLWVDALCINQLDLAERAAQVQLMSNIYEQATGVIVWLGEMFSDVEEAPRTLNAIAQHLVPIWKAQHAKADDMTIRVKGELFKAQTKGVHWDSLAQLLMRGWFQRVWCIQEVVKAKAEQVVVKMGPHETPWTFFATILASLRRLDLDTYLWSAGECHGSETVDTMLQLNFSKDYSERRLLKLLQNTRSFKSTMPVDKIYGVLGLASDAHKCGVTVDYTLSAADVFTQFAKYHIEKTQSLDLLYSCAFKTTPAALNVPSWVPDWTQPQFHVPFFTELNFAAAKDTKPHWEYSRNALLVRGVIIDTVAAVETKRPIPRNVERVGRMFPYPDEAPWRLPPSTSGFWKRSVDNKSFWESSHESWMTQEREHRRVWIESAIAVAFPDSECTVEQMEALWRTFVCDLTDKRLRPTADWAELFPEWITLVSGSNEELSELYAMDNPKSVSLDFREQAMDSSDAYTGVSDKTKERLAFGRANARCYNRRFFRSGAGRFGWGVEGMAPDDKICVIHGMSVPLLLRPEGESFTIIGDAYLHGTMYGEGLKEGRDEVMLSIV